MTFGRMMLVATLVPACTLDGGMGPVGDVDTSQADLHCAEIFFQDEFPEYRVELSEKEWAALEDEFLNRAEREEQGLDPNPYHPATVTFNGEEIPNAMIRLKGQSSWWAAIMFDENPKMQFVISFNEIDKDGRFHGLRKVELDMPRTDASFLRQRLALYSLRNMGIAAQCANNAKLFINGEYYGLYTHMERLDKEFLQRVFGDFDEGNLWKGGRFIETNEENFDWHRLDQLWYPPDGLASVQELADLDASVRVWAAEAMIPHGDGYYNGRANFFLYDHPTRGFIWLPHDLDSSFDFISADTSPLFPECEGRFPDDRIHWSMVLAEDRWLDAYVDYLRQARDSYEPRELSDLVTIWAQQIGQAAYDDPMKPFVDTTHDAAVESLRAYPPRRAETVDRWLDCRENGGEDGDGDGYSWCFDCDDGDPERNPDAAEVCNGLDDNCDGQIDEPIGEDSICS